MTRFETFRDKRVLLAFAWLIYVVAMSVWWLYLGLTRTNASDQQTMLITEGATLILILIVGGAALIGLLVKERNRQKRFREFYASFSHEIKTSLASLQIQIDALEAEGVENLSVQQQKLLERLRRDGLRLRLQLENSLFLANVESSKIFPEKIQLSSLIDSLARDWPNLKIKMNGDAVVLADRRAVDSIFKNFLQNAHVHGKANSIQIGIDQRKEDQKIKIQFQDDGGGLQGDRGQLGKLFERVSSKSGSSVGLYLSKRWVEKMKGRIQFPIVSKGFCVELTLPGAQA